MAVPVTADHFPPANIATEMYERDLGSCLTTSASYAVDPFDTDESRQQCQADFLQEFPDLYHLMNQAVNENLGPLQDAVLRLVDLTHRHTA